ncbi:MAG TPA: hypothetical protein VHL80_17825, partial [Polyangia bacterium]|nr:hypothetical protein [Polyangia bacterium]
RTLLLAERTMRTLLTASLLLALTARSAFGADAGASAPPAVEPYDAPAPAAPASEVAAPAPAPPPVVPIAPRASAPAPQATDDEAPRRGLPTPLIALPPPREPIPEDPSEPGRVVAESILAFITADFTLVLAAAGGGWPIFLAPIATGGVVCGIGSGSEFFDGSCAASIGGAYLGALLAFPMALAFSGNGGSSDEEVGAALGGLIVGYVIGTTAGAVIGWNASRSRKPRLRAVDVAALDAASASRAAAWTEPLRPRGSLTGASEPRFTAPQLALRF